MTVQHFPASWRFTAIVVRSGGRDPKGNPLPETEHPLPDCMMDPGTTTEPIDRSDVPTTTAWLHCLPGADVVSTDRIVVPEGMFWSAGTYAVDGDPKRTPLGTSIPLRSDDA